jgi:hypothetical protein
MPLDHDGEGRVVLVLVPGQRKSPVHLIGGGDIYSKNCLNRF